MPITAQEFCVGIVAFIFPPLAVLLDRGCGLQLLLNIVLTLLGWIPGVIHALIVICGTKPSEEVVRRGDHHV